MRLILLPLAFLIITSISCERKKTMAEGEIQIYLLSDHASQEPLWETNERAIILEDIPLIDYTDIYSYDARKHSFKITASAQETFKSPENTLHTRTFALVANHEIIYTGYFWSSLSSAICPWLIIDPLHTGITGELTVQLGYPCLMDGMNIPDRRNDERILSILRHDRKLIE
jgi:hypothetical protein